MEYNRMSRLFLVLWGLLSCTEVLCQKAISNEATPESNADTGSSAGKDSLEDTVFNEMLRIVDQKFDSLSARISVLERSINSLNFYSVRQFRDITESIEQSTETTEGLRSQISKMDADDRALKAAVSQVGRDINDIRKNIGVINVDINVVKSDVKGVKSTMGEFRSNSERMLDDIANSIVYFNENSKKKTEEVKSVMQETLSTEMSRASDQRQKNTALLVSYLDDLGGQRRNNCSVDFRPLEDRIEKRFTELKHMAKMQYLDLLNAEEAEDEQAPKSANNFRRDPGENGRTSNDDRSQEGHVAQAEEEARERSRTGSRNEQNPRDGEKVMRMLANMTQNVMEATAYFRMTGGMMERLLATTESMAAEQTRLRYDMLEASGLLVPADHDSSVYDSPANKVSDSAREQNNMSESADVDAASSLGPESPQPLRQPVFAAARTRAHKRSRTQTPGSEPEHPESSSGQSQLPDSRTEESLRVLKELAKNGTLLLDVLTDLAQLSSTSLTKAVGSLHEEVVRLEDVRARLNEGLLFPGKASSHGASGQAGIGAGGDLSNLQNTTKTIFTIVEAIASNTGWIPYIFHNMQQVERLTNRTLELAKRSLLNMHWNRPDGSDISDPQSIQQRQHHGHNSLTQAEALDFIYETNVKFLRIMPALTRLLAEPEPLIALADGINSNEGRVEVFFKGRWGPVCRKGMGHEEASVVCRHLGHSGGIWAGDHHFGHGTGHLWQLNMTCLDTQLCPFIVNPNSTMECPDGHFAVICDHMLRITPTTNQGGDVSTGLLTMHHQGRWLPICGQTWSGYEARVACKQMGFKDGRELEQQQQDQGLSSEIFGNITAWVSGISCTGEETRLDACEVGTYQATECPDEGMSAGVRCQ